MIWITELWKSAFQVTVTLISGVARLGPKQNGHHIAAIEDTLKCLKIILNEIAFICIYKSPVADK